MNNAELSDVKLVSSDGREFFAHRCILYSKCKTLYRGKQKTRTENRRRREGTERERPSVTKGREVNVGEAMEGKEKKLRKRNRRGKERRQTEER